MVRNVKSLLQINEIGTSFITHMYSLCTQKKVLNCAKRRKGTLQSTSTIYIVMNTVQMCLDLSWGLISINTS